ncbi:MAG: hypothetical protein ACXVJ2_13715 [Candidatus Angelobacter sp.]
MLEHKEDLKARGEASPDDGDCLAMSFSVKVAPQPKLEGFRQEWVGDSENAWMM